MLRNPSFDDFDPESELELPANWSTNFNDDDVVPPANDGDIHTGDGSVVFQLTESRENADVYQTVPATEGCCYSLEFWAKGSTGGGDTGNLRATIQYLSAGNAVLGTSTLTIHGGSLDSNSWTSYRLETPPSPDGTTQIKVTIAVTGHGKSARIDDVILTVSGCGGVSGS